LLIRKTVIDGSFLTLNNKPGEMIRNNIFGPRLILNL